MQLVLIGMSGVGKSTWARRLARCGFRAYHCDEAIAARIRSHHRLSAPFADADLGRWLGMPDEPGFAERERLYLHYEREVLHEAADLLARPEGRLAIDTSGSAVYCGAALFAQLRQLATIVYLAVSPADHAPMLEAYLRNPRPVIWHGMFQPRPCEDRRTTFARCYPALIHRREALYAAYSDLTLTHTQHRRPDLDPKAFLAQMQH